MIEKFTQSPMVGLMVVNKSSWHFRLYMRIRYAWSSWFGQIDWVNNFSMFNKNFGNDSTNVCQYIRTIFLWGPLYLIFPAIVLIEIYYLFVYWPDVPAFVAFGTKILWGILYFATGLSIIFGVGYLCFSAHEWYTEKKATYQPEKPKGFLSLIWQWIKDKHNMICTIIEPK